MQRNGFVTIGMLAIAASVGLMLMACHSTPPANGFAASTSDKGAEARRRPVDAMPPLQPFDEHFVQAD